MGEFKSPVRIVIVGGGYVGMYTAMHLQRKLKQSRAEVTVIDPQPNMTYQPFLPEAAAGNLEPRHVVVPLRRVLRKCRIVTAAITAITHANRTVTVQPAEGASYAARLRPAGRLPGLDLAAAADPGAGRSGHRVQDDRRGDLPAQSRARPARPRLGQRGRRPAAASADLRLRRRRVRRGRGLRRAAEHVGLRDPLLPDGRPRPTCAGCWSRRPTGSCPRSRSALGDYTAKQLARAGIDLRLSTRLDVGRGRAHRAVRRRRVRRRHPRLDGRGAGQPDARRHRPAPRRQGPAAVPRQPDRARPARRLRGRRLRGRPRCDQRGRPARCSAPARSTRCARPRCWPPTSRRPSPAGSCTTTGTSTSARSPRSGSITGWPSCTG